MTPKEMRSFIHELGVKPRRIMVGSSVFADFTMAIMMDNPYQDIRRPLLDRIVPPSIYLMGVQVVLAERLDPAAFEFDMEAAA